MSVYITLWGKLCSTRDKNLFWEIKALIPSVSNRQYNNYIDNITCDNKRRWHPIESQQWVQ